MEVDLAWQGSLFGDDGPVTVDTTFATLHRVQLDAHSWVDYAPDWLRGSDSVLTDLMASGRWQQREVWMYDRRVREPRLTAGWSTDVDGCELPDSLRLIAAAVSQHYRIDFDRIWVNLYRDGRDSVAWHRDRNHRTHRNPTVATVSLGARRAFRLRPRGGRTAHEFLPGHGDLLVMGGACQHDWEHTVPKTSTAVGPRISVTLRHSAQHAAHAAGAQTWSSDGAR
jgi:alkylated DNA repair dioxygenase AlkB